MLYLTYSIGYTTISPYNIINAVVNAVVLPLTFSFVPEQKSARLGNRNTVLVLDICKVPARPYRIRYL